MDGAANFSQIDGHGKRIIDSSTAQKQFVLQYPKWSGLLCYTGIAKYRVPTARLRNLGLAVPCSGAPTEPGNYQRATLADSPANRGLSVRSFMVAAASVPDGMTSTMSLRSPTARRPPTHRTPLAKNAWWPAFHRMGQGRCWCRVTFPKNSYQA